LFVDPELKPKLFPILDDSSIADKLHNLQLFYPRESYNPIQVLNYILNRDYNLSNRWTKACASYTAAYIPEFRISRGLVAQVFNSDKLLQETAAWVIYGKDKNAYEAIKDRLPIKDKKYLDSSIENNQLLDGLNDGFFLYIEMIMLMKQLPLFRNINGNFICDLADKIIPLDLSARESIGMNDTIFEKPILIVAHGTVNIQLIDDSFITLNRGGIYGDLFQDDDVQPVKSVEGVERSVVFKINVMDFYFAMANHHELVDGLIKNITAKQPDINTTV
jgi:hypothetical protein